MRCQREKVEDPHFPGPAWACSSCHSWWAEAWAGTAWRPHTCTDREEPAVANAIKEENQVQLTELLEKIYES